MTAARRGVAVVVALAATLLIGMPTPRAADDPSPRPGLEVTAPRFDAGRVEAGTALRHTWELRNRGPRPLQIAVQASCGCTTMDFDREIAPGAVGHLTAVVDTTHLRGRIEKVVDVSTNDPAQPMIPLSIVAECVRALVVEPGDAPTLRGALHAVRPLELTVRAADERPFRIVEVRDDAIVHGSITPLDDGEAEGHRRYRLTLTPSATLAIGIHHAEVTLATTAPGADRFVLPTTVVVTGPLVAMPPRLRVGAGQPTASVRVSAVDGSAFRVLRAETSDPDVTAEVIPSSDPSAWDVTVHYVGAPTRHGPLLAVLRVVTDQPAQPTVEILLTGKR